MAPVSLEEGIRRTIDYEFIKKVQSYNQKKNLYQQDSRSFSFSEMKDSFAIEFEKLDEKKSVLFEKEANAFDIKKRYEYHKKEFLAYIDKLRKYPE